MLDWRRFRWGDPDSLERFEPDTDARPVGQPTRARAQGPDDLRRLRLRRGAAAFFLGSVFVAGVVAALVGKHGWRDLQRKGHEARALRMDNAVLAMEVGVLSHLVDQLESDPAASERVAREQLGMIRTGELTFLLPKGPDAAPHP